MTKILYIDPVSDSYATSHYAECLNHYKASDSVIDVVSLKKAPPTHITYQYYEVLAAEEMLHTIKRAENDGYDICIIGCFYDPFLTAAREITSSTIVVAPAEASMHLATTLANSFTIVVTVKKCIPQMKEYAISCGFGSKLMPFKSLDIPVDQVQSNVSLSKKRIDAVVAEAVAEGSESIILGCTEEYGLYRDLQEKHNVPVIDPIIAALKYGEYLHQLKMLTNWYFSKALKYQSPPVQEILDWNIEGIYGVEGLWRQ